MAGPGDEIAAGAGGHSRLRASHADREQVIDVLKTVFVEGRLARDEFDLRVGQALGSRTYAELAAVTADLPAGRAAAHGFAAPRSHAWRYGWQTPSAGFPPREGEATSGRSPPRARSKAGSPSGRYQTNSATAAPMVVVASA